jgi:hypothetical protein
LLRRYFVAKKPTNPKDEFGAEKVALHVVPCNILMDLALGMAEGSCKYGSHNYREMGVRASIYFDAAMRHLMAWWEGEDIDPDSGLNHVVKAMTSLVVLRDSMHMGNWDDDRPIKLPRGLDIPTLNAQFATIMKKYPNPKAPFTARKKKKGEYA